MSPRTKATFTEGCSHEQLIDELKRLGLTNALIEGPNFERLSRLGRFLARIMALRRMTQNKLGRKAGMSQPILSNLMYGKRLVTEDEVAALAVATGFPVKDLRDHARRSARETPEKRAERLRIRPVAEKGVDVPSVDEVVIADPREAVAAITEAIELTDVSYPISDAVHKAHAERDAALGKLGDALDQLEKIRFTATKDEQVVAARLKELETASKLQVDAFYEESEKVEQLTAANKALTNELANANAELARVKQLTGDPAFRAAMLQFTSLFVPSTAPVSTPATQPV